MPYLKFHPAGETLAAQWPISIGDEQLTRNALHMVPAPTAKTPKPRDVIGEVERAIDLVDSRLKNLRQLVDQFGLDKLNDDDDGPRAA